MDYLERFAALFVRASIKALSEPGVLSGLIDAWRAAMEPKLVEASKPNKQDDAIIEQAKSDGWSDATKYADH